MSTIIEAAPDRQEQFGERPGAERPREAEVAENLQVAYQQRFALYETQLADALNLLGALKPELAPSSFPRVSIVLDAEEEEVVFDFGLYERLLEIYIYEGWTGISLVEEALDKSLSRAEEDSPSGGTPVDRRTLWLPVKTFFRFTRNLLALLIRETLVGLEQKAAGAITANLSISAWQVAKAWVTDFQVVQDHRYEYEPFPEGHYVKREFYRFENRPRSDALFAALSEAVRQRVAYDETLQREARFREAVETNRGHLQRVKERAQPQEKQRLDQSLAKLDLKLQGVEQITAQSRALLSSTLSIVHASNPLGLIVLGGLGVGFTQGEMEDKLGMALRSLREKIEEIGQGIDPNLGRVASQIPSVYVGGPVAWDAVQRWDPPAECLSLGIEHVMVDATMSELADDPGWLPLAHEATWHRLVESGTIAKDSFEYVVYAHYVSALIERLESERRVDEMSEKFWGYLGRIAAALSLASLATPATAGAAPLLRGLSVVADLAVMAHEIYSITGNLARLDQALAQQLIHPDAFALEHLARLGELAQIRREALDQISVQVALELAALGASASWGSVKNLMLARGYYSDLETLLGESEQD